MCTNSVTGSLSLTNPAALLLRCLTPQTDRQYSYYAKKFKGCLSSEIICVEHDTHIGIRVSPVKYSLENRSAHQ